MDHAVLIVGYDLASTPPYWILKTPGGTAWGEEGYILLGYNENVCLVGVDPCTSLS